MLPPPDLLIGMGMIIGHQLELDLGIKLTGFSTLIYQVQKYLARL